MRSAYEQVRRPSAAVPIPLPALGASSHRRNDRKATLPVLYGLAIDHPARTELADIVRTGSLAVCAERVRDILEGIDTHEFLVWCAFEERVQALSCLERHKQGSVEPRLADCAGLIAFADLFLMGWESLLPRSPVLSADEFVP